MCPTPAIILSIIITTCTDFSIPCDMFQSIAYVESRYNPYANNKGGDKGLYQISKKAAKFYDLEDPFDPQQNAVAAAKHLIWLKKKLKTWDRALLGYNWGITRVLNAHGKYPQVALKYVKKVRRYEAKIRVEKAKKVSY